MHRQPWFVQRSRLSTHRILPHRAHPHVRAAPGTTPCEATGTRRSGKTRPKALQDQGLPRVVTEGQTPLCPRSSSPETLVTLWLGPLAWKTPPLFSGTACSEMTGQLAFVLAPRGTFPEWHFSLGHSALQIGSELCPIQADGLLPGACLPRQGDVTQRRGAGGCQDGEPGCRAGLPAFCGSAFQARHLCPACSARGIAGLGP